MKVTLTFKRTKWWCLLVVALSPRCSKRSTPTFSLFYRKEDVPWRMCVTLRASAFQGREIWEPWKLRKTPEGCAKEGRSAATLHDYYIFGDAATFRQYCITTTTTEVSPLPPSLLLLLLPNTLSSPTFCFQIRRLNDRVSFQ